MGDSLKCENIKNGLIKFDKAYLPHENKSLFDVYVDTDYKWKEWRANLTEEGPSPSQGQSINEVLVDTVDTLVLKKVLYYADKYDYHLLLIGPTGSGKTAFIKDYLKGLAMEKYL